MNWLQSIVLSGLVVGSWTKNVLEFPEGFKFGSATSSYQIEGGWNASDKAPSIWDVFVHERPELIANGSTGDVACDSYNLWKDDIQIASDLGLHFYRFSISWPRILPSGTPELVSEDGYRYYKNLIDGLLERDIEPVVTMYHWELPQRLQNLGGWANSLIAHWFGDYARVLYSLFGDKVKTWITINEPIVICIFGFEGAITLAPGVTDKNIGSFQCNKNLIMAHAKAYRIYEKEFKDKYQGRVGISNNIVNLVPATEDDEDITELAIQYYFSLDESERQGPNPKQATIIAFHLTYEKGGWPSKIEEFVAEKSKKLGFINSRLPAFTDEEKEFVKGTGDFFGLNYYTGRQVRKPYDGEVLSEEFLNSILEIEAVLEPRPGTSVGAASWSYLDPLGIRTQLKWLKESFGDIEIVVTENGHSTKDDDLEDDDRIIFYKEHLEQVLLAIHEDDVKVTGYTAWSLMDNFEWGDGYSVKFGLYQVDFEDPQRKRTPRASARYYANIIRTNSLEISNSSSVYDEIIK